MFDKNIFARRVRSLRTQRHISQDDLAKALSVTKTYVSDIERGRRTTPLEKCHEIADFFNVSLDYLTGKGIFAQWEKIMECKDVIINQLIHDVPALEQYDLFHVDERELMHIFPALIHDISIKETQKGLQIDMELHSLWEK